MFKNQDKTLQENTTGFRNAFDWKLNSIAFEDGAGTENCAGFFINRNSNMELLRHVFALTVPAAWWQGTFKKDVNIFMDSQEWSAEHLYDKTLINAVRIGVRCNTDYDPLLLKDFILSHEQ